MVDDMLASTATPVHYVVNNHTRAPTHAAGAGRGHLGTRGLGRQVATVGAEEKAFETLGVGRMGRTSMKLKATLESTFISYCQFMRRHPALSTRVQLDPRNLHRPRFSSTEELAPPYARQPGAYTRPLFRSS
jgi:hypothetical protein